ncbi:MAG TPA: RNA-binding S4 domain-containing protein [Thermoanaerobaculia bacterium]|nr:RNA-binding S4 domain-containing protein [Thermoanaerobaculia bacterium]
MSVRLDKWLQVARVFKTRTQATKACDLSRVRVNGVSVKPHRLLQLGDRVEIEVFPDWSRTLVVRELAERPLPKAEVPRLYEDLSPPRPPRDSLERLRRRPLVTRDAGAGRPTKKERRELDDFWADLLGD